MKAHELLAKGMSMSGHITDYYALYDEDEKPCTCAIGAMALAISEDFDAIRTAENAVIDDITKPVFNLDKTFASYDHSLYASYPGDKDKVTKTHSVGHAIMQLSDNFDNGRQLVYEWLKENDI